MSMMETAVTAAAAALFGGGSVGLWFKAKVKKIIDDKIDLAVEEAAELIKFELPQIEHIKAKGREMVDVVAREAASQIEKIKAGAEAGKAANKGKRPPPDRHKDGVGSTRRA